MSLANNSRILINKPSVDYIRTQLDTGHSAQTKRALQYLCKLYRSGHRIRPEELCGVEQSIVGILYTSQDEKVRRWALNALARFGRPAISLAPVLGVLKDFNDEPQTAAAAIAAIYRMQPNGATKIISDLGMFDPQVRVLAAMQHVDAAKLDQRGLPINIEIAPPDVLKLGLIVVGLDRAPANLFHPRHSNGEIVRVLGSHHDCVISQYTVWAIAENDNLGLSDLGIPISSIETQPANVRAWIYQLIAMSPATAEANWEYIELGAGDPETEARLGLAAGLRETYYDGIEALILDWFSGETDQELARALLDHMIRQSSKCPSYEDAAIQSYEKEGPGSAARKRMEAYAAGLPLYARFQRISYDGSNDLFRSMTIMNTTINGGIQAGAVSVNGDATNMGTTNVHYQPQIIEAIQTELTKAIREIHTSTADPDLKEQALEHVRAAQADPTPDKLTKAIGFLGKIGAVTAKVAGVETSITTLGTLAESIAKLVGFS